MRRLFFAAVLILKRLLPLCCAAVTKLSVVNIHTHWIEKNMKWKRSRKTWALLSIFRFFRNTSFINRARVCHKRAFSSAHYTQKVDIKIPTIIGAKKGDETLHFVNTQKKMAQVQTNDALVYVRTVKVRFSQEPAIYEDFLNVMRDFKSGRWVRMFARFFSFRLYDSFLACIVQKIGKRLILFFFIFFFFFFFFFCYE